MAHKNKNVLLPKRLVTHQRFESYCLCYSLNGKLAELVKTEHFEFGGHFFGFIDNNKHRKAII